MKIFNSILLSSIFFLTFSCQNEENDIEVDSRSTLTSNAPLFQLVERVVQNPTSLDNVLDSSSCFAVQLPVTIIVNSQQITVSSAADYQLVQDAIDAFSTDDDIVNFIFPITIQFQNFDTQVIVDSDALEDVLEGCEDGEDEFNEIECISFHYPIVLNTFDSTNQLATTVTFQNDIDFYNFLDDIDETIYIAINYPISVVNSNSQTVIIHSNAQLENALEEAIEECNATSNITLASVITDGTWRVSYFFKNNLVQTNDFVAYEITFFPNETMQVVGNGTVVNGVWTINASGSERKLEIELEGNSLIRLEEKWKVIEYSETLVKMRLVGEGNGGNNYLYLTKN
ncbi:hypothetical protein [Flavobacterium sp. J27]|uniref:hypothetical protein n=1 Tax=Flavobacterium sp. J27 TaxID=2060419 RepID=UPI00102FF9FF|nr:hypothetical protein [Flavobacterium sp. J27]